MFLKSLILSSNGKIIRDIKFHNGINLIVDETHTALGSETGNNVGKTTVLMLIDYCLGSSAKDLYTDPESRKEEYKLVKDYLQNYKILVSLTLKEDLAKVNSDEIMIERNFLAKKHQIRRINGVDMPEDKFEESLTDILFPGHYNKKPSFRQIISHNIRYTDHSLGHTLKTLDPYTKDEEYETLYLFLLGCDFQEGDTKQNLLAKITIEQTLKKRLEREQTKSAYETALALLEREIEQITKQKAEFNLNPSFESDLDKLNGIKYQINLTSSEVSQLTIQRDLIIDAEKDLQSTASRIDTHQLELIYRQATDKIGLLQKTFEDLLSFHNQMISEKVKYITKDLPRLQSDIQKKRHHLQRLLENEATFIKAISKGESFEELEEIIKHLNSKYRKKGEYESTIQKLNEVETNLQKLNGSLSDIDNMLFSKEFEQTLKDQRDKFNNIFSQISDLLYGEQYALKVDPTINTRGKKLYKFSAFNTNFSSGKKQGEISCFDIAYTIFADTEGIPCFHFILNDKKELMHDNQLVKIAQLVNSKNIQFIASILKDKLPDELNKEEHFILKLSQNDKLFRIEKMAGDES
ncbi:MAG: hypothetical protein A2268_10110 [Candidatus Raymondbacteria bacterium RifOxyA12_full_50_37]|uniref:DUF2326 domain-containing protein n=1 Tax=Candidatus Raymondbacteria bacterium RIFOXYD12_FULL_49_13 TaxID=1817890 RepID=A0A1F7F404_UNCRA|nr:MAG: hypothetical protein A2268_10110 [Candidatus Raymondbacteria bacterium RifOxyA12_full_50_37]OGJ92409.1 MAG: hypothetical protein A2350_03200 [Candidatus Raymondbacteria bacterium RifOxyB12_full_50_8]OGJ93809.1 MAG: hypothetical protein A2248_06190 [Candidatus Raymondbacteria bacterium RIFOXYA2_FULL_49_16]OGJ94303.1 MAG: hypothetical protein A2487_17480 [Candidatus Raymondbacteria bacterium RifOxyC12_full_50_8]OGJ98324.1 MAG: hypothetical protein A2453_00985 [Candidatus Raymondbacteria b